MRNTNDKRQSIPGMKLVVAAMIANYASVGTCSEAVRCVEWQRTDYTAIQGSAQQWVKGVYRFRVKKDTSISKVQLSCSCDAITYPRERLLAGDSSQLVIYHHCKQSGTEGESTAAVQFDGEPNPHLLTLKYVEQPGLVVSPAKVEINGTNEGITLSVTCANEEQSTRIRIIAPPDVLQIDQLSVDGRAASYRIKGVNMIASTLGSLTVFDSGNPDIRKSVPFYIE